MSTHAARPANQVSETRPSFRTLRRARRRHSGVHKSGPPLGSAKGYGECGAYATELADRQLIRRDILKEARAEYGDQIVSTLSRQLGFANRNTRVVGGDNHRPPRARG
jgi:hypothetical protein